jgi:dihydrofolate reductase
MSMSLDGFDAGPDDGPGRGLGVDGESLHAWLGEGGIDPGSHRPDGVGVNTRVFDEMMTTRAVITGRRTFDFAGGWDGDHHDGIPVFVLTRTVPDEPPPGSSRYVTDVKECVALAKQAAAGGDVMMHGASAAQAVLAAGLLDEMEVHLVPMLLGQGRRLFDHLPAKHVELELLRTLEARAAPYPRRTGGPAPALPADDRRLTTVASAADRMSGGKHRSHGESRDF